jgi:WD40 repeat protein
LLTGRIFHKLRLANTGGDGRHSTHSFTLLAKDLAGNIAEGPKFTLLAAGSKSYVSQSLKSSGFRNPVYCIRSWNTATGELVREYLHAGPFNKAGAPAVFLEELKAIGLTRNEGLTTLDLTNHRTVKRHLSLEDYDGLASSLISPNGDHVFAFARDKVIRVSLRECERDLVEEVKAATLLQCPDVISTESPACLGEPGRVIGLISLGTQLSTRGYHGSAERHFVVKDSDFSPDGTRVAFLFHYNSHPGPNWIQVWDVKSGKTLASFTYAPCPATPDRINSRTGPPGINSLAEAVAEGQKRFPFTSCAGAKGDESFVSSVRLSYSGKFLAVGGVVLEAANGARLGRIRGEEPFTVTIERDHAPKKIVADPDLWSLTRDSFAHVRYSRDGKLALHGRDYAHALRDELTVYDLKQAKRLFRLGVDDTQEFRDMAFSADGGRLNVLSLIDLGEYKE